jgi:hypothetical protein
MGFLSRVIRSATNVTRAIGRGADDLRRGDLSGAAQARRDAGRTVVHDVKRDLGIGSDEPASGRMVAQPIRMEAYAPGNAGPIQQRGYWSQCQSQSRDFLYSNQQLRNSWGSFFNW